MSETKVTLLSRPKLEGGTQLSPQAFHLPRCPREVWEKVGSRRFSLGDVTAHGRNQV